MIADHPGPNVLINNAGVMQPDAAAGKVDDAVMVSTITTKLMGPIRMTSALIEHLKAKENAVVAYTSSVLGFVPLGGYRGLFIDKGGVAFVYPLAALHAAGHEGSSSRNCAPMGPYGAPASLESAAANLNFRDLDAVDRDLGWPPTLHRELIFSLREHVLIRARG
ncbi:SDR family NAD(P)-dependent oxidoreductase [Bradyrhizobium sp. AZCC 2289]|uniref:SDR family NAD(P)-dependent oxidoreductase n=1 Tax=Bradyrhizobium sp. AZCC 2289 TaxID=3117026 RepID=UPI002FF1C3BE